MKKIMKSYWGKFHKILAWNVKKCQGQETQRLRNCCRLRETWETTNVIRDPGLDTIGGWGVRCGGVD